MLRVHRKSIWRKFGWVHRWKYSGTSYKAKCEGGVRSCFTYSHIPVKYFAALLLRVLNFSSLPTYEDVPAADKEDSPILQALVMSTAVLQLIKHLPRASEKACQGMMEKFILLIVRIYIAIGIFLRNAILQIEIEF